jgi:hypothetical protein
MTTTSVRRLYLLTGAFAILGFVSQFAVAGPRNAFGFLMGALGSFGNLWLFDWLSRSIAPGERQQKPWQASLFIGRYIVLIAVGYATVKALDVGPLAVLLGLLASSAAALISSIFDLVYSLLGKRSQ